MEVKEEELMRMQGSLIELRTENYDLKDANKRLSSESSKLRDTCMQLEKDCEKANRTVSRSKKARDVQALEEELERMHATVGDFEQNATHQNQTLLDELAKCLEENERLKKQLEKGDRIPSSDFKVLQEEIEHLKAENSVLKSSFQKDGDTGSSEEVELKVATQTEEIKALHGKLSLSSEKSDEEISKLKEQLKTLENKIDHKQELILKLQNEKEQLGTNLKTQITELETELKSARETSTELEQKLTQSHSDSGGKINELEHEVEKLRARTASIGADSAKEFETLKNEHQKLRKDSKKENEAIVALQNEKSSIEERLNSSYEHIEKLRKSLSSCGEESQNFQEKLKISTERVGTLETELNDTRKEVERLSTESAQAKKLAESRKNMLDRQSIENQERIQEEHQKFKEKEKSNEIAIEDARKEKSQLESQIRELKDKLEDRINQERTVKKLETQRSELESKIETLENIISERESEFQIEIETLNSNHGTELETLRKEIEKLSATVDEKERFILKFGQEKEELKISFKVGERKNLLMIKELKKQLQVEQKRSQKFQDMLVELRNPSLTESIGDEDTSSVGGRNCDSSLSWHTKSGSNLTLNNADTPIQEETRDLIDRLTNSQQQKWVLEQRCSHLEDSNAALNNDLLQKEFLIKNYVIKSKADLNPRPKPLPAQKSVSRKLLSLVIPEEDEFKDESFRKVQRALEEEMTKNIHLKENLESLTTEMAELESKLQAFEAKPSEN